MRDGSDAGQHEVRPATSEDASLLARMLHDFNTEYAEPTPGPEILTRRVLAFIENGQMTYLLGGAGPDGFAQVSFRPTIWADAPVGYLEEFYVMPRRRGQGIGRALMTAVLDLAHARGAAGVEVVTGETDTAARGLYESFGFLNEESDGARSLFYELNFPGTDK